MNIFITGGTGFLGSTLANRLIEHNHTVYILVRNIDKARQLFSLENKNIHILEGNVTEKNLGFNSILLEDLKGKIDAIYHTAAFLSFDESKREEILKINISGTQNVLNFAEEIKVGKFIHVSTAYTLGARTEGKEVLYPTDSKFINSYEESKCKAEHLVMSYQQKIDVMIMRPSIIVGSSDTGQANTSFGLYAFIRTIKLLSKKAEKSRNEDKVIRLLMEKTTVSNLVPIDYVVKVLIVGLTYGKKGIIYNITNPNPPTNEIIFESILEGVNFDSIMLSSYAYEHLLTEEERAINKPLSVFKHYLNRSINFSNDNTTKLLEQANESLLNMDQEMLLRIIKGNQESKLLVTK